MSATAGPADRTTLIALTANLDIGDTADPALRLAYFQYMTDLSDANYNYVLGLVTSGTLSPLPPNSVQYQSLFNGGFLINQRVVSGTVTLAAGAYGHDRWKAGAAGCTYTFATSNNITTITITAGSLVQVIEGTNLYDGTYTLSWTGTAQGKIGAGSYGVSGITGTVVGGTNLSIEFNTGTLNKAQLNKGSTAFTYQPRSFAEELALCQRYYEKSYDYSSAPGAASFNGIVNFQTRTAIAASTAGTLILGKVGFMTRKRTSPTMTLYGSGSGTAGAIRVNGVDRTGCTVPDLNTTGFYGVSANNSSATVIALDSNIAFQWIADAEL